MCNISIPKILIPEHVIRTFIYLNVKWEYESYDYWAARAEFLDEEIKQGRIPPVQNTGQVYSNNIPNKIKQNHIVWRTGKIRSVSFNPQGKMYKFIIGNKINKTFYLNDFGVRVKPRIYISDDEYGLISKGLAVEETN